MHQAVQRSDQQPPGNPRHQDPREVARRRTQAVQAKGHRPGASGYDLRAALPPWRHCVRPASARLVCQSAEEDPPGGAGVALTTKAGDGVVIVAGRDLDGVAFDQDGGCAAEDARRHRQSAGRAAGNQLTIYKSFRNIPGITVRVAPAFSVRDVLDANRLL